MVILKLGEDADFDAIADKYAAAGFTRPEDDAISGGVWTGGPDVVSGLEGLESPELQNVAFLPDEGLLLSSDSAGYLRSRRAVRRRRRGRARPLRPGRPGR